MTDTNATKVTIKGLGEFSHPTDLILKLVEVTSPVHLSDHQYEDDPTNPGLCLHCRWLSIENAKQLECGHTLRHHLEATIQGLLIGSLAGADFNPTKFKALLLKTADEFGLELDLPEDEIRYLRSVIELVTLMARLDMQIAEALSGVTLTTEVIIIEEQPRRRRFLDRFR